MTNRKIIFASILLVAQGATATGEIQNPGTSPASVETPIQQTVCYLLRDSVVPVIRADYMQSIEGPESRNLELLKLRDHMTFGSQLAEEWSTFVGNELKQSGLLDEIRVYQQAKKSIPKKDLAYYIQSRGRPLLERFELAKFAAHSKFKPTDKSWKPDVLPNGTVVYRREVYGKSVVVWIYITKDILNIPAFRDDEPGTVVGANVSSTFFNAPWAITGYDALKNQFNKTTYRFGKVDSLTPEPVETFESFAKKRLLKEGTWKEIQKCKQPGMSEDVQKIVASARVVKAVKAPVPPTGQTKKSLEVEDGQ